MEALILSPWSRASSCTRGRWTWGRGRSGWWSRDKRGSGSHGSYKNI